MSAQASNPSHLLLSRNPRSPAHPQLAPTWTARHPAPANGWSGPSGSSSSDIDRARFPSNSFPPVGHPAHDSSEEEDQEEVEIEDEVFDVHPTFRKDAALPGRIKVIVGRYEFWCHKEVLWFACPFFQDVLQGSWAETSDRRLYETSASPLPSLRNSIIAESISAGTDTDQDHSGPSMADVMRDLRDLPDIANSVDTLSILDPTSLNLPQSDIPLLGEISALPPPPSIPPRSSSALPPLDATSSPQPTTPRPPPGPRRPIRRRSSAQYSIASGKRDPSIGRLRASAGRTPKDQDSRMDAVVQLHEESASAFHDFLFWAYPHLECKVTWTNVENLLALACKLIVPALQKLCEHFLLTHASGKPVMALSLAEQHGHAELFREASRFVLDQSTWNAEEMDELSDVTQLKLSQRRTWFLERLLKLGTIDVRKEYACRPECPDSPRCQALLDEKWRQAHQAVCRYGPPQPSVAFRCLRQLETFPTNPSLVMPHPLCQSAAKTFIMLPYNIVFDRMFQPKTVTSPLTAGTEKYWLFITLY
ncbi:uncharacterized protein MKK02DRAFT_17475 [Dioszegia hungarica]|uniref:BTB domain-containing protein n=1 Tax=Dioszegia hungarica TaxID=4972 RepID=A0AA38H3R7_9TREE|nr:uncharacterized protein MKK02DRAFT_17475 [Dioszegia hungarica]KAI9634112.1 hypothetical protein MKK02DRAFT_17475 [Dioszegia hungarica]